MARKKENKKEPTRADLVDLMFSLPIVQVMEPMKKAVLSLRLRLLPEEKIASTYNFFIKEKEFMVKIFNKMFDEVKKVDEAYFRNMEKISSMLEKQIKTNKKT